jgi:hypothetical protein
MNSKWLFLALAALAVVILISGCIDIFAPSPASASPTPTATPPLNLPLPTMTPQPKIAPFYDPNFTVSSERSDINLTIIIMSQNITIPDNLILACNSSQFSQAINTSPNQKGYRVMLFDTDCIPTAKAFLLFNDKNLTISIPKVGGIWHYNLTEMI